MDDLLTLAQTLAQHPTRPITHAIKNRVAYVVSHGQSYASNGYAIRTQGIAKALNQHGLETLCFVRPNRPWELDPTANIAPEVKVEGVRYIHSRWPSSQTPNSEQAHLQASVDTLVALFRVFRPAAVLAASNWQVGLPAWIAAKRLGLPFYYEVRGFWELSRAAKEPSYTNSPAYHQATQRDTFVAKQAQTVFTLNPPMQTELVKRGVKATNIALVPNGVSQRPEIKPASPELKKRLGIQEGEKVVGYVGSMNAYEGLDVLLEACAELVEKGEKLKLLLVGDDQLMTEVTANSKTFTKQPWLIQVGRVPHTQVADYYSLIDAVVIPRKKLPVCELVPPMKAAEALAYGKRLVVSDVAPLVEYAEKHNGVVTFEAGKAGSLRHALKKALELPVPKVSAEVLFSAYIEPMVKALKGERSTSGLKAVVEPQAKPQAETQAPTKAAIATPLKKPAVESKTKEVERKDKKHKSKSFVESEVVDYSYGDAVYADGHQVSSRFYDLSQEGLAWGIEVEGCQEIDIFFNLKLANAAPSFAALKEVVAKIEFYDASGNVLNPSKRIPKSPSVGSYVYLKISEGGFTRLSLPVPSGAHQLRVKVIKWGVGQEVYISSVAHHTSYKKGVSIVIPSYKGEGTILECLDSLAAQTLAKNDFEIIIILNGEPDGTSGIVNRFKKENPEINLLLTRNEATGAGAARNHGISLASREYTTFVDDDDFVSANFLQGLLSHSGQNKIVVSNIEDFNGPDFFESPINQQIKRSSGSDLTSYEKITSAVTLNACKLVPTRLVKSVKYNDLLKSGEDVDYWTRLVCLFNPSFRCVDEGNKATYYRRVRENSVSRQIESFEFNVKQRLEVVIELEKVPPNDEMRDFVTSKINAQLGFINRYLGKFPEVWNEFKDLAEKLEISSRAFQYVNEKQSQTLVISYCFPPYIDTAGIVCAKRLIEYNKPVDVISNTMKGVRQKDDNLWKLVKPYIGSFQEIDSYPSFSNWKAIEQFCEKALKATEKNIHKYKEIYSRSMWPGSHFAAALIKINNPDLKWIAEFSDPLRVDVKGKERSIEMSMDWLNKNNFLRLDKLNKKAHTTNKLLFYWCELLPYALADKFVFTNESQKSYMIGMLNDISLKKRVSENSVIASHPTLPEKFYSISNPNYNIDNNFLNLGYFGAFYETRGIGDVLSALKLLDRESQKKVRIHIFTPKPEDVTIEKSILKMVKINNILPYFDFLSLSKKFDALIVSDAETKGIKWVNPYLPSKLSDYKGSGASIWALCEEGSELDRLEFHKKTLYRTRIGCSEQSLSTFLKLLKIKKNAISQKSGEDDI